MNITTMNIMLGSRFCACSLSSARLRPASVKLMWLLDACLRRGSAEPHSWGRDLGMASGGAFLPGLCAKIRGRCEVSLGCSNWAIEECTNCFNFACRVHVHRCQHCGDLHCDDCIGCRTIAWDSDSDSDAGALLATPFFCHPSGAGHVKMSQFRSVTCSANLVLRNM